MKSIFIILFFVSFTLYAQNEIIVQPTDADSLWHTINEVYRLEGVVVIRCVTEYGFILRQGTEEFICNTNTMPKEFWEKIRKRKIKQI
jgi:hypothetical protein